MRLHFVCLFLLLGASACSGAAAGAAGAGASQPDLGLLAVGPYLLAGDARSMSVCWTTSQPDRGAVEFGATAAYGRRTEARLKQTRQKVTLDRLEPGTTYHYRVMTGGGATADLTFRTLPGAGQPLTFVADGDQRGSNAYMRHLAAYRRIKPAFVVSLGDICNDNGTDYDAILLMDRGLWAGTPWYPVFGNHDVADLADRDGRGAMWDVFAIPAPQLAKPATRLFYGFAAGGCRFVAVDEQMWIEQARKDEWALQRDWMEQELKAAMADRGTKFVFSLRHDADDRLADADAKAARLEDVYFFGGIHNYFRGQLKNGLLVVQSSGGGVDHLRPLPNDDWIATGKSCFNYVRVDVRGDKLTLRAYDLGQPDGNAPDNVEGDLIDTFELASRHWKDR